MLAPALLPAVQSLVNVQDDWEAPTLAVEERWRFIPIAGGPGVAGRLMAVTASWAAAQRHTPPLWRRGMHAASNQLMPCLGLHCRDGHRSWKMVAARLL